ncbi:MAG TPA: diacylglycerol kinase family protein [Chloroflexota bacterium]|nr:diacylglycerol kinase family protein [Chloroflexota bacterium]
MVPTEAATSPTAPAAPPTAPPVLIFNPQAGAKLGLTTNPATPEAAQEALTKAGVPFEPWPTARAGHATELAARAVAEGRRLVIAAGGDGTVGEVAQSLIGTETLLGVMPMGSVMNVARTLQIPRNLDQAAQLIAGGRTLAMDVGKASGRVQSTYFLEAAGVGLDAALFRYFDRVERGRRRLEAVRAAWRFLRSLGLPRLMLEIDGVPRVVRAPMITVANSPFLGAAYAIAPEAEIDDGRLDVVIFHHLSGLHVLAYLIMVAGGRPFPRPRGVEAVRVRSISVATRRRPLPAHADGTVIDRTPVRFEVVPKALHVITGPYAGSE